MCIFLLYFRNCRALRFVCTTFICSTPNTIKHSTTQHKTIHYTKYFLGNLHVSLRGVKTVLKIERYMQWLTQGRNKLFGRSKLQDGLQPAITQLYKYTFHKWQYVWTFCPGNKRKKMKTKQKYTNKQNNAKQNKTKQMTKKVSASSAKFKTYNIVSMISDIIYYIQGETKMKR